MKSYTPVANTENKLHKQKGGILSNKIKRYKFVLHIPSFFLSFFSFATSRSIRHLISLYNVLLWSGQQTAKLVLPAILIYIPVNSHLGRITSSIKLRLID